MPSSRKRADAPEVETTTPAEAKEPARRSWPATSVEMWPIERIVEYPQNARLHSNEQIQLIAQSMERFGVTAPVLVDEAGILIYGHGRRRAAQLLGIKELPVCIAVGWTEDEKRAYRISDNQLGLLSEWDRDLLSVEIKELAKHDFNMPLLGFPDADLAEFVGEPEQIDDADRGALLSLVNITINDPAHKVERGDHYVLEGRHHLVCTSVVSGWHRFVHLLKVGSLFCPYPGVFVPFGHKAEKHELVMVQPDPYIAGHMLDRWVEVKGLDSVKRIEEEA